MSYSLGGQPNKNNATCQLAKSGGRSIPVTGIVTRILLFRCQAPFWEAPRCGRARGEFRGHTPKPKWNRGRYDVTRIEWGEADLRGGGGNFALSMGLLGGCLVLFVAFFPVVWVG